MVRVPTPPPHHVQLEGPVLVFTCSCGPCALTASLRTAACACVSQGVGSRGSAKLRQDQGLRVRPRQGQGAGRVASHSLYLRVQPSLTMRARVLVSTDVDRWTDHRERRFLCPCVPSCHLASESTCPLPSLDTFPDSFPEEPFPSANRRYSWGKHNEMH